MADFIIINLEARGLFRYSPLKKKYKAEQRTFSRRINLFLNRIRHTSGTPCVEIFKSNLFTDRKALDEYRLRHILGLTEDERNEVYRAVCESVKNRLEKAGSV